MLAKKGSSTILTSKGKLTSKLNVSKFTMLDKMGKRARKAGKEGMKVKSCRNRIKMRRKRLQLLDSRVIYVLPRGGKRGKAGKSSANYISFP